MIRIISNKTSNDLQYTSFNFSGGEVHVKLEDGPEKSVRIIASLNSSDEIFKLILLTDALKRKGVEITEVFIPYVPYARQDRVMNNGEALSIKVFCELINSQNYKKVVVLDPHSEVTTALLNNVEVQELNLLEPVLLKYGHDDSVLFSPDAGALKKIYKAAQLANYTGEVVTCSKHRDTTTGKITDTIVPYRIDHYKKNIIIVDDICDGGRTFIEIAKKIKLVPSEERKIVLVVTHGIFSQGLDVLKEGGIDKVYTTNSFKDIDHPLVTQFSVI